MRRSQLQLPLTPPQRHLSCLGVRGVGLIDGLISLAILAFGLLAMTRMQTNLVRQASESQARIVAAQLADELLNTALVDVGNAACYTLPAVGTCTSVAAKARADDWQLRALKVLPGTVNVGAALVSAQLTVSLTWTGKESSDPRTLQVTTDVRP